MSNNSTYKKRLLKLAETLEALPRKRFDYTAWVGENWGGKPNLSCGTTACALGWATTIKSFRKLGLRLMQNAWGTLGYVCLVDEDGDEVGDKYGAGTKLFGLNLDEFHHLFMPNNTYLLEDGTHLMSPDSQATPKQVAKHIRRFVKMKYGTKNTS